MGVEMTRLMHGFPPSADGQVSLANWRRRPFSRWTFDHVRELLGIVKCPIVTVPPIDLLPTCASDAEMSERPERVILRRQYRCRSIFGLPAASRTGISLEGEAFAALLAPTAHSLVAESRIG